MKNVFFIIALFTTVCVPGKTRSAFSLSGTTDEIKNGTVLYLKDNYTKKLIDSAIVNNNRFYFKTHLQQTPMLASLYTKDKSRYHLLWLENKPMIFEQNGRDFSNAQVSGSDSQNLYQSLHEEIDRLPREENFRRAMEFVESNPNSIVSAMTLSLYSTSWGKEKTKQLFDLFSEENKSTGYGRRVQKYIDLNANPEIGDKFVDFSMPDTQGNIEKLSNQKGKLVLLEFWASWCRPCRAENPELVKTYSRFNPKGFEIVAISIDDDKEDWLNAIEEDNLNWKHLSDLLGKGNSAFLIYGVQGVPSNFLIDKDGTIIGKNLRGEKLNETLNLLLNE